MHMTKKKAELTHRWRVRVV